MTSTLLRSRRKKLTLVSWQEVLVANRLGRDRGCEPELVDMELSSWHPFLSVFPSHSFFSPSAVLAIAPLSTMKAAASHTHAQAFHCPAGVTFSNSAVLHLPGERITAAVRQQDNISVSILGKLVGWS